MTRRLSLVALELWLPVVVLVGWWLWSAGAAEPFFPPLQEILTRFREMWLFDQFVTDVLPSLRNMAVGFGIASRIAGDGKLDDATALRSEIIAGSGVGVCAKPSGAVASQCSTLRDDLESADRWHNLGVGAFVGAGVVAIGSVATYVLWPRLAHTDRPAAMVVPSFGPDEVGLGIRGRF